MARSSKKPKSPFKVQGSSPPSLDLNPSGASSSVTMEDIKTGLTPPISDLCESGPSEDALPSTNGKIDRNSASKRLHDDMVADDDDTHEQAKKKKTKEGSPPSSVAQSDVSVVDGKSSTSGLHFSLHSDSELVDGISAVVSGPLTNEIGLLDARSVKTGLKKTIRSISSDLDSEPNNRRSHDSEGSLSDDSIQRRRLIKESKSDSPNVTYLGSVPEILDSGSKMGRAITANQLILPPEIIDGALAADYAVLPPLRNSKMIAYKSGDASVLNSQEDHTMISYSKTLESLSEDDLSRRRFERAVKFESSSAFVNPSRASPSTVIKVGNKMCLAKATSGSKSPAVCITTGVLTESNLRQATTSGYNSNNQVHQVKLNPISGEFELAAGFFGTVFAFDYFACLLDDGSLTFATRPEGTPDNKKPPTSSRPAGRSSVRASVPAMVGSTANLVASYPGSLGFNDLVPIYDARKQPLFQFSSQDLANLQQLPFYKHNKRDPAGGRYVCTAGYGVNSWSRNDQPCISLNIIFLIILGQMNDL